MAVELVSDSTNSSKFDVDALETASTDLVVADALLLAIDNFVDEIRDFTKPNDGIRPEAHVFESSLRAQTLLGVLRDKILEAKTTIDVAVEAAASDGLGGWSK